MCTNRSTPARAAASASVRVASSPPHLKLLPASPVADLRRAVEDQGDIADRPIADRRIGEITALDLHAQSLEEPRVARLADQGPDPVPLGDQLLGKMAAQQPGRPRHEDTAV